MNETLLWIAFGSLWAIYPVLACVLAGIFDWDDDEYLPLWVFGGLAAPVGVVVLLVAAAASVHWLSSKETVQGGFHVNCSHVRCTLNVTARELDIICTGLTELKNRDRYDAAGELLGRLQPVLNVAIVTGKAEVQQSFKKPARTRKTRMVK